MLYTLYEGRETVPHSVRGTVSSRARRLPAYDLKKNVVGCELHGVRAC